MAVTYPMSGGCSCGSVRYELTGELMFLNCCHCTDCQRDAGSAFALNGVVEAERIRVTKGEVSTVMVPTPSGRGQIKYYCAECATTLWNDYGGKKYQIFLRTGTLDEAGALAPDVHIYVRSKQPWMHIPEGVPQFETFYSMKDVWPAEALARRAAASDAFKAQKAG